MKWILDIGQHRFEIADGEHLRNQLLKAHTEALGEPVIALLNAPDGSSLAIGLGSQRSVLNYISLEGWPRHAIDDLAGEGFLQFKLADHISEVPVRGTVQVEDAIDACVNFMTTGNINRKLTWEDD